MQIFVNKNYYLILKFVIFFTSLSLFVFLSSPGYAQYEEEKAERVEVCAKYQTESGWSEYYTVTSIIVDGSVLNEKTGTLDYDSFLTYAVIFWGKDKASVLDLDSVSGEITVYGTKATDQRGRTWRLSKPTSGICY